MVRARWVVFAVLMLEVGFAPHFSRAATLRGAAFAPTRAAFAPTPSSPWIQAHRSASRVVAAAAPTAPAIPPEGTPSSPSSSPSPNSSPTSTGSDVTEPGAMSAGVPMVDAAVQESTGARYGLGLRLRVTSVPKWLLGLFLAESVPLTSYTAGLEFFRRSGKFDLVLGVAYQPLSPGDGNWLGKSSDSTIDTDYVQFRGLAAYSVDVAFIFHTEFNEYVGMHYGGGIGVGIPTGSLLRTSAGSAGCANDPGNLALCHPVIAGCDTGPCTEAQLQRSQNGTDSPQFPSRFSESRVPSVYPIVNLVAGLDVRLPTMPGFAVKLDLGYFFPYFFLGLSGAYQI
jgi:hypothetical protein